MKRSKSVLLYAALAVATCAAASGCVKDDPNQLLPSSGSTGNNQCPAGGTGPGSSSSGATSSGTSGSGTGSSSSGQPVTKTVLDERILSYPEALRTASFKIVGNAPTLQQIEAIKNAGDQAKAYEAQIDAMMSDVRFSKRMIAFWRNTMRMGGAASGPTPSRETAPTFAARIVIENRPFTDLFTATTNTCPTFDGTNFVDGSCNNGPITAGILADPGIHALYHGNLAFRTVRFFQETFACRKQPAELSPTPMPIGTNGGSYTSPWPFDSIAGTDNGGRIDFHDTSSAICANCHSTSNHRAPLLAYFDVNGQYQPTIQVDIPIMGTPKAQMTDWLPPGQTPAWKFGVPTATLTELGAAMAADDEVLGCAVIRMWNYAMSKGDVVIDAANVPGVVYGPLLEHFKGNGYNLKDVLRKIFLHGDFVRF